jgi:hypothetical protein
MRRRTVMMLAILLINSKLVESHSRELTKKVSHPEVEEPAATETALTAKKLSPKMTTTRSQSKPKDQLPRSSPTS